MRITNLIRNEIEKIDKTEGEKLQYKIEVTKMKQAMVF